MIHDINEFTVYKSILCLNGDLPPASFFLKRDLPVIAADGAANTLVEQGITPCFIIGDLDSVYPAVLEHIPFQCVPEQDSSDYQKALVYLQVNHLLPAIVVGVNGGHLDHVLNNINLFLETECLLYAPPLKGFVLKEVGVTNLDLPCDTKISFMGIPHANLSSEGLKWNLDKSVLSFPGVTSCFNRTESPQIKITVHQGMVLVLIYEHPVQDAGHIKEHLSSGGTAM